MISVLKNPCNLYTAGWVLYYLQGTLYEYGSPIAKVLLALILLCSLVFVFNNRRLYDTSFFRAMFYILLLYVVYTIIFYTFGESFIHGGIVKAKYEALKQMFLSLAPICCYYGYAKKGYMTKDWFKWGALVLLLSAIGSFFWERTYWLSLLSEAGSSREEMTNNSGYLFAAIIPMLVLMRSKIWYKYALFVVSLGFSLFSMKRGALLVVSAASLLFILNNLKTKKVGSKISVIILSVVALMALVNGASYLLETSDYFNVRVDQTREGFSSGRDELYTEMISYFFNETNVFRLIFGYGIDGTGLLFGNGAHNDWIEFAIDMGFVGIIFYLVYWLRLYSTWRKSHYLGNVSVALAIIIVSELLKSFFSFSINNIPIQLAPAFGYCLACTSFSAKRIKS